MPRTRGKNPSNTQNKRKRQHISKKYLVQNVENTDSMKKQASALAKLSRGKKYQGKTREKQSSYTENLQHLGTNNNILYPPTAHK